MRSGASSPKELVLSVAFCLRVTVTNITSPPAKLRSPNPQGLELLGGTYSEQINRSFQLASDAQWEKLLYSEHQRVPLVWWLFAAGVVAIISWQAQMGRPMWAFYVSLVVTGALAVWALLYFSRTKVEVTEDSLSLIHI